MKWFNIIQNKATPKVATVQMLEQIGEDWWTGTGVIAKDFMKEVRALGDLEEVRLEINSPGGSVHDGVSIANFIIAHSATWNAVVIGQAASIASVIASACDTIEMGLGTNWCAHKPSSALYAMGTADDFRHLADDLDTIEESIIAFYMPRIEAKGKTKEELVSYMAEDRYMTADEALEWGFVDSKSVELKAVAFKADHEASNRGATSFVMKAKDEAFNELKIKYDALVSENEARPPTENTIVFNGSLDGIGQEELSLALNKHIENTDWILIDNKKADAADIAKVCAENGLDHLISPMIENKVTASKLNEMVAQTKEIKTLCAASGIDSTAILKNIQNPVEMLRQGVADAAALSEQDQDSTNSSGGGEKQAKVPDAKAIYKNRNKRA
jgi:ATP-dependent protease ClpP protease subunit